MHLADALRERREGEVVVHPAVQVFSQWVEQLCTRIQMLRGQACDQTADAITLQRLWQEAMPASSGLSPESEKRLAGRLARTADKWLRQWYGAENTLWLDAAFYKARLSVTDTLRRNQLRDADGWTALLIEILQSSEILPGGLPEQITLDGFHEFTRLEQALLRALEARGVTIQSPHALPAEGFLQLQGFNDARTELAATAHWAKQQVADGKQQIAVIINGLENQTQTVQRVFENVFYRGQRLPEADTINRSIEGTNRELNPDLSTDELHLFCIPAGQPLLDQAVIESALMLLQLSVAGPRQAIPFSRFSFWMLNPFWAAADSERIARAHLEIRLRRDGVYQLVPASLQERAAQAGLAEELQGAIAASRAALNPDWRAEDALYQCLKAWGWPGPLVDGSRQQSAINQFVLLLERLRGLNLKSPTESLQMLRQMCQDARVKGAGGPLSPVQILSPDDAAGRRFDAAWVANLHEGNWPSSPLTNPYLPADAAQHIPRARHEGELAWTKNLTTALRCLAPEIIFSWGRQSGDTQLGPSPLLSDIPICDVSEGHSAELHHLLFSEQNYQHLVRSSDQNPELGRDKNLEKDPGHNLDPNSGPDTGPASGPNKDQSKTSHATGPASMIQWRHYGEHPWLKARIDLQGKGLQKAHEGVPAEAISGGAAAISDQSALPLLSYLKHRLNARFDPIPDAFADAALRGSLLHGALQRLYQPSLGSTQLPDVASIPEAVENALRERNAFQRLSLLQFESEKFRLIRVLEEWLEKDGQRPSFRIHALELPLEAPLLGHPIRVRADRIDQLDDGSLLIIDYKSSKRATNAWARPRLGEAQVPLYARLLEGTLSEGAGTSARLRVGGIALAAVKHGECLLDGVVSDSAHACDKLQPLSGKGRNLDKRFNDWPAAMAFWQESIDALAAEYIRGDCSNVVYDRSHPGLADFQLLLRHSEGEAWLLQAGADVGGSVAADSND